MKYVTRNSLVASSTYKQRRYLSYKEKKDFAKFSSIKKRSNTHSSGRCLFHAVQCFFPKNPETTCAEICEKQQGKKSAKSLFLTCWQGGLAYVTLMYGSRTAFKTSQRFLDTAFTLSYNLARSCLQCKIIILLFLG